MRLDEMVIKANEDGKTYFCNGTNLEYSKEKGFLEYLDGSPTELGPSKYRVAVFINGWEEKPIRHLTVSEAEKELDCVIDTPDISKLFRSSDILPEDGLKIILLEKPGRNCYSGFYDAKSNLWRTERSGAIVSKPGFYIKWSDLIKLLPKE